MDRNVTILARNPFTDKVKTRLASEIGESAAQGVYARLLYQTIYHLIHLPQENAVISLSLPSIEDRPFFEAAFPELSITQQSAGTLGDKMFHALQSAFQRGAQQAVVIGSDLPAMSWELLNKAFKEIRDESIVIGPSLDGGYYLIGMQTPGVDVFQNIPWSTESVLHLTLERVRASGYKHFLLPELQDIDHLTDWQAWQARHIQK